MVKEAGWWLDPTTTDQYGSLFAIGSTVRETAVTVTLGNYTCRAIGGGHNTPNSICYRLPGDDKSGNRSHKAWEVKGKARGNEQIAEETLNA